MAEQRVRVSGAGTERGRQILDGLGGTVQGQQGKAAARARLRIVEATVCVRGGGRIAEPHRHIAQGQGRRRPFLPGQAACRQRPARDMIDYIYNEIYEWSGGHGAGDDVTFVIIKAL